MGDVWAGDAPHVEFLILAEHVEAVHGKLYMMGGAWEILHVADFNAPVPLSLAVSVLVPWHATNRPHAVDTAVETADGEVLAADGRQIMVGRPAHIEPGTSQRTLLVMQMAVELPGPGRYVAATGIDGVQQARASFRALPAHGHA